MEEIKVPKSIHRIKCSDVKEDFCPECPNGKHVGLMQHEVGIQDWKKILDRAVKENGELPDALLTHKLPEA